MSTDFVDTDKKDEKPPVVNNFPTFDVFGMKIKQDDAQNFLIAVLGLGMGAMAINTFAPRLNPFNKPKEEPKPEKKEKPVKKQEPIQDIIEYEPLNTLQFNNNGQSEEEFGMADIVDRLYDDPDTIVEDYKPSKKLSYKEISEDIFGNEKKVRKKIPSFELEKERILDISSDLT